MQTSPQMAPELRCVVCRTAFNFTELESALVLRHVAYGYDFVHDGLCLDAACERIFPEPGYDCAAFGRDTERRRVLGVTSAEGWAAILPNPAVQIAGGQPVRFESLRYWALVEHQDGSRRVEGLVRDETWLDEPGGAEFPEAPRGQRAILGYAPPTTRGPLPVDWAAFAQAGMVQSAA